MTTVMFSEVSSILDMAGVDLCHTEISFEGEGEKESSENLEELSKVKFNPTFNQLQSDNIYSSSELLSNWSISSTYLEIHSPPPETL